MTKLIKYTKKQLKLLTDPTVKNTDIVKQTTLNYRQVYEKRVRLGIINVKRDGDKRIKYTDEQRSVIYDTSIKPSDAAKMLGISFNKVYNARQYVGLV